MCQENAPIRFYQIVEVIVPNGTTGQLQFPDVPNLRNDSSQNVIITDIEFFPISVYANSQLNTSVPGATDADVPNIAFTLYVDNEEPIRGIPLAKINYTQADPAAFLPFQQQRTVFDKLPYTAWQKCFFQFSAASTGGPYVIPLGVTYIKQRLQ